MKLKQEFIDWFFQSTEDPSSSSKPSIDQQSDWWKVMCLTGVDYFSTLGYQPGIAVLAAGALAPFATLFLVVITLFGALPAYCIVAENSPFGKGSISMLEKLLKGWNGKLVVLVLLGFVATAFIFTITLSTADAAAHIVENPFTPKWFDRSYLVPTTLVLIGSLGLVLIRGFKEAIGLALALVSFYLFLNFVLVANCMAEILKQPEVIEKWWLSIDTKYTPLAVIALSALYFPKLALGLSGFETGVAVMPLVKGKSDDDPKHPKGRIQNTKKLLFTAALIMSFYLIFSSIVTTVLIPSHLFAEGQAASGRALAYLAHAKMGETFGTVYDVSTISILWFAGASAFTGLLTIIPAYLPRYGMAPTWARSTRPLVLFFLAVCFSVTVLFNASVDAQACAYATGVLILITSACVAALISVSRAGAGLKKFGFMVIALVFVYATIDNTLQQPNGLYISLFFIASVIAISVCSRSIRSTELRISTVSLDQKAKEFLSELEHTHWGEIRILAHRPGLINYQQRLNEARIKHSIQEEEGDFIFFEVEKDDPSEFIEEELEVKGKLVDGHRVFICKSPAVANAIAALLIHIRDKTNKLPHAYFGWTEGHPLTQAVKYVLFGEGETASLTREILRKQESDDSKRPFIHVV